MSPSALLGDRAPSCYQGGHRPVASLPTLEAIAWGLATHMGWSLAHGDQLAHLLSTKPSYRRC